MVLPHRMEIVLRPQICDVTSPYVYNIFSLQSCSWQNMHYTQDQQLTCFSSATFLHGTFINVLWLMQWPLLPDLTLISYTFIQLLQLTLYNRYDQHCPFSLPLSLCTFKKINNWKLKATFHDIIKLLLHTQPTFLPWRFGLCQRLSLEEACSVLLPVLATTEMWRGKKSVVYVA